MKIHARWEVTEVHSAEIEVDDDFDPEAEGFSWSSLLAEEEGNDSYDYTAERDLLEYEPVDDDSAYDPHGGAKHRVYEEN